MVGKGHPPRVAPDALLALRLGGDGGAVAHAFVEVDMGTMTQRRLQAKLGRYLAYCRQRAWVGRHPHCPALLLLTTSDRRAQTFLAAATRQQPTRPRYGWEDEDRDELVVAACASVADPDSAATAAVWRTGPDGAPVALNSLLGAVVAAERRRAARQAALDAEADRHAPMVALGTCKGDLLCSRLGDEDAAQVLEAAMGALDQATYADREAWARHHADVLIATAEWWLAANDPGVLDRPGSPPPEVVEAWRALHPEVWADQAATLLHAEDAITRADPRLRALAARLGAGELVAPRALSRLRTPLDGRQVQTEALGDHETRRARAARATYRAMRLWRRLSTDVDALADAYDDEHLMACAGCGVARPRPAHVEPCPICGGGLRPWPERWLVPSTDDSLAAVRARLDRTMTSAGRRR